MASVTFTRLWISPASDLSSGIGFRLAADSLEDDPQTPGQVRPYAAGRFRLVTSPGNQHQLPVTIRCDTRDEVAALTAWQNTVVLARDPKGRKFYAAYQDLKISERAGLDSATATLTLVETSMSEAV
jgi:hypothetical protein